MSTIPFNLLTNKRTTITNYPKLTRLLPNRSTELTIFEIPTSAVDSDEANQVVIAAYLHDISGKQLARAVNWPEPLEWVHFSKPENIGVRLLGCEPEAEPYAVRVSADVCIKGLQLEGKGENLVFEENLGVRYFGMGDCCGDDA